jgi:hypothetical protein
MLEGGLEGSFRYVQFEDEEATKLAFLHLKNLGKTFDGKVFVQYTPNFIVNHLTF